MGERIRRMDAKQVETILKRYRFLLVSQKGSYRKWRNDERNLQVIVPYHKSRDLLLGTLRRLTLSSLLGTVG